MTPVDPSASYDSLYIVRSLQLHVKQTTLPELHVFAYLACLLALYDGRPVSAWGYDFVATENTSPFSRDLLEATQTLLSAGLFAGNAEAVSLTDEGQAELENWQNLQRFAGRNLYLRGATGAASTLPMNAVTQGISNEPQVHTAGLLSSPRTLLDEVGRATLYEQFGALEGALGAQVSDLMVPAIIWITYLLEQGSSDVLADGGSTSGP